MSEPLLHHILLNGGKHHVDFSKHSQDEPECLQQGLTSSASRARSSLPLGFIGTAFIGRERCPFVYWIVYGLSCSTEADWGGYSKDYLLWPTPALDFFFFSSPTRDVK